MWTLHFYMIHMLYILHFTWINIRPKHLDSKIFRFEKYCSANSQAKILHLLNFYCSKCLHVHCSLPSNYTLMIICFICGVLVSWFVLVSCLIVISNFWIVMLLFVVPFVLMQGSLHASLVEVVRAHKMLRTSPYCKRIFSKTQFKKWCSNKTTTITICCCVCVFRIYAQSSLLINLGKVFMLIYNMWLEWIVFIKFVLVCVVFYMIFYLDAWFIFISWDLSDIILYLNFFFK
jgi:hypothetical protein